MSDKSASQSSNGSAADLKRCVQQLLIESDEQEKNMKKLEVLKSQFQVLKKINSHMSNEEKLQHFLRNSQFRQKVQQKFIENNISIQEGIPILKIYLVSTRFKAPIEQQFDQMDLVKTFQRFGYINQIYLEETNAYILYQQFVSVYLAMKILNQFQINEKVRLRIRICTEEEYLHAQSAFYYRSRAQGSGQYPGCASTGFRFQQNGLPQLKYIAKFQFQVENLPEFNISQRLIGPKGSYMKKIIQKMLSRHPLAHKYNLNNIDSVFKMRIRGKGSGFFQSDVQSQQKLHLFVSTKEKWMYEAACQQVQILLIKIFQDYKIAFQKLYRQHAIGIAYKILQYQGNCYNEIRRVHLEEIQQTVDLLSLENQGKLPQKIIQQKIKQREQARKQGKYQQSDQIRNWLKSRGVILIDSKYKGGKTTWSYMKLG